MPGAAGLRTGNLPSHLSLLRLPSLPPRRPRTATPPSSSPPLSCLQPGGGSDPRQLTQHRHCLSHSPRNTPWAQRRVCSTAATTQAAAPTTLNCLPDRRHHRPTPRKTIAINGRRLLRAPQNTFAIDSSYVNNYGRRGAAGGAGKGRVGAVRHAQGSATGGKAPARPSKWRQQ